MMTLNQESAIVIVHKGRLQNQSGQRLAEMVRIERACLHEADVKLQQAIKYQKRMSEMIQGRQIKLNQLLVAKEHTREACQQLERHLSVIDSIQ